MPDTVKCPKCDTEIGATETKCPKCGVELADFDEETLLKLDAALSIIEKRRNAQKEKERKEKESKEPLPVPKRKTIFDSLKGRK